MIDAQTQNYRISQFNKINQFKYGISIKIFDDNGNTNQFNINEKEFNKIRSLLTGVKQVTEYSLNKERD